MATNLQGGYEYDFVDADTLPDRLVCQICHYPCREARLTGCCGAHFCFSCLKQIRKGSSVNKACPICRVERFKDFPNKQLDREIKGMRVYCLNRNNGCTWVGEVNDVTAHFDFDCQFVDVYCPSRCGSKMKRQCVNLHLEKHCPCYCKHCGASGSHIEIALRHKERCHMYPMPCPNGCELGVTGNVGSYGIEKHRKVCPLEMIQCEYHNMGCMATIFRKDLGKHVKEKMTEHFSLLKVHLAVTNEELKKTEKKLAAVEKDLVVTKKSLDKTKSNYKVLSDRLADIENQTTSIAVMTDFDKIEDLDCRIQQSIITQEQQAANFIADLSEVHQIINTISGEIVNKNAFRLLVFLFFIILYTFHTNQLSNRLVTLEQKLWPELLDHTSGLSNSSDQVAPMIFNLSNVTNKLATADYKWQSKSFFAFKDGYKMALAVSVHKTGWMDVSLYFLKERFTWPSRDMFIVELLNPKNNSGHYYSLVLAGSGIISDCSEDETFLTCSIFFHHLHHLDTDQYLANDTMYLQVSRTLDYFNYPLWFYYHYYRPNHIKLSWNTIAATLWNIVIMALLMEITLLFIKYHAVNKLLPVVIFIWSVTAMYSFPRIVT